MKTSEAFTRHELIALAEAISREIQNHRTGYAVSSRTDNRNMQDFHQDKIAVLQSAYEKLEVPRLAIFSAK